MENYPVPDLADVQLVEVLRALGDPIRLEMVRRLADGAPRPKSELVGEFTVQKSTLSHHFKTLRECGLTRWTVNGRTHAIELRRAELDARFPGLIESLLTD
ncbi:helix-turn-helix transcriptional regulator [Planctomonas sp. JC2975]|nr:helix-turn-helix transcriptional regulator [Planctomonas sp. JC2975]